ncbi:MAG: Nif3-like dinuclear metal center hexameric protein [Epulopiscium sp.]|nr:Nif3-like dinuclear metal center hexameric protein [Candidatus Epulonipiscium sp.]
MSVKVEELIKELNNLAPEDLAMDWDNVGLQVGSLNSSVSKVLLALDASPMVIKEAIEEEVDMIITHHPMIFSSLKTITEDSLLGNRIYKLIRNNISLYVMHTNFDAAFGGTNDILANKIGLYDLKVINPDENGIGIGRIGNIKETSIKNLASIIKEKLGLSNIRIIGNLDRKVSKVAICTGSGMSFIDHVAKEADVFITGDVKFHDAQRARDLGLTVIDAGHYGTENIAMPNIKSYMKGFAKENNIEIVISKINDDPFITI